VARGGQRRTVVTMSSSVGAGVEDRATPAASSSFSSLAGTMPPTITRTSASPAARSASISLGTIRWSVASDEMPITSASSSIASFTTLGISCHGGV
jgi:hypothetical protein